MKKLLITISLLSLFIIANAQSEYKTRLKDSAMVNRIEFISIFNEIPISELADSLTVGDILEYKRYCYKDSVVYCKYSIESDTIKEKITYKHLNKPTIEGFMMWTIKQKHLK